MNTSDKLIFILKGLIKRALFLSKRFGFREYHHFPFDTNAPMPEGALAKLNHIVKESEIFYKGKVRISDGTLLGLARNRNLISHDTDLDFDVIDTSASKIRQLANEQGWYLGREVYYKRKIQQLTFFDENKLIFDFIFWYRNGRFVVNYSERGFLRVQPIEFFIEVEEVDFGCFKGWVPADINSWLIYRYGENWEIPAKGKGDWKAECGDLIKII